MKKSPKIFYTYEQQIEHLRGKKLVIENDAEARDILQRYSYYACVSAYKDIFKEAPNGNYKPGTSIRHIMALYEFDADLRNRFLRYILMVENHIKSLYSYSFCQLYGDREMCYRSRVNYDYARNPAGVDKLLGIFKEQIENPQQNYVKYNHETYGEVPLWVLIHSLTLGNLSNMYALSLPKLQSEIAKKIGSKAVFSNHLIAMLSVLTKFRNTCAHNERLYSYRTKDSIEDMPVHADLKIGRPKGRYRCGKNDLFSVVICLKYLLPQKEFAVFAAELKNMMVGYQGIWGDVIFTDIRKKMGFPPNWYSIVSLHL